VREFMENFMQFSPILVWIVIIALVITVIYQLIKRSGRSNE
jgi:hypothetical protein